MASPDLDYAELHVSLKDYFTRQPYIDASGLTTLDLPYESIDVVDQMYEPAAQQISTATITLPSLLAFPELRPLLQNIKEGNRVELYSFQPDCGCPVFAGFIPPNGITEKDGRTTISAMDTLAQLRWQHLRKYEYLNQNAAGFYTRALSAWQDLINEDWAKASAYSGDYSGFGDLAVARDGMLYVGPPATGSHGYVGALAVPNKYNGSGGLAIQPGDTWLLEADLTLYTAFVELVEAQMRIATTSGPMVSNIYGGLLYFYNTALGLQQMRADFDSIQVNTSIVYGAGNDSGTLQPSFSMPATHHLTMLCYFSPAGVLTANLFLDHIQVQQVNVNWLFDSTLYVPELSFTTGSTTSQATNYAECTSFRFRRLRQVIRQAPRFNPQTADYLTYQPNAEENLQLLQLIAQKDNAEYRPVYKPWPQTDELELDALGTLGAFPSRALGYDQPGSSPLIKAPDTSPFAVDADAPYGDFLTTPPFRIEEGWNLESAPEITARETAHSNDVVQLGASTLDAQVFGEKWSAAELGRPQHSPSGAVYPCFEQIVNDDRVFLDSLADSLAGYQLAVRTDGAPSLTVAMVDEVWSAFKWRAGDNPYVITRSLRTNVEQEMRVVKLQYKAGSPVRTLTLGRLDQDPEGIRLLTESARMQWLYEQSGTSPTVYVYPSTGSISSGTNSPDFTIVLDQYTSGSAIVSASLHWFADANVLKLVPVINGGSIALPSSYAGTSATDSGLVTVTQCFQSPGTYKLHFNNSDSVTRSLTAAFLVLRIKG